MSGFISSILALILLTLYIFIPILIVTLIVFLVALKLFKVPYDVFPHPQPLRYARVFITNLTHTREVLGIERWLGFGPQLVWIISAYRKHKLAEIADYYVVPVFDAQASALMMGILPSANTRYDTKYKMIGSNRFLHDILRDNFVLLCLPDKNQYAKIFLGLYHEVYVEERNIDSIVNHENIRSYVDDKDSVKQYFGIRSVPRQDESKGKEWQIKHFAAPPEKEWYRSSMNMHSDSLENIHKSGHTNYDYAIIVKAPNPLNPEANILIVGGIHGVGTFGGVLYLYRHKYELFRKFPHRAQAHLIEIQYQIKQDTDHYSNAQITEVKNIHNEPLSERL
jgi:hypothetical protein